MIFGLLEKSNMRKVIHTYSNMDGVGIWFDDFSFEFIYFENFKIEE
jgi:hypothetical protein